MRKILVLFLLILSVNVFAQFENVININKKEVDRNKYSYIYNNLKDIEEYNNPLIYSFENIKKEMIFKRYFKENDKFIEKETDYKIKNEVNLNFHGLKLQNILIKKGTPNGYSENGFLIIDENKNILEYFSNISDYKLFPNKLMILYSSEFAIGVFYICYEKNKPFWGYDISLPKWVSGHTGIGIIRKAEILGENYIKCSDVQKVTEIYRVKNSKYDYEENSKLADKIIKDKPHTDPKRMKLMWFCLDEASMLKEYNRISSFQIGKSYDNRAHDFIDSISEPNILKLIK